MSDQVTPGKWGWAVSHNDKDPEKFYLFVNAGIPLAWVKSREDAKAIVKSFNAMAAGGVVEKLVEAASLAENCDTYTDHYFRNVIEAVRALIPQPTLKCELPKQE